MRHCALSSTIHWGSAAWATVHGKCMNSGADSSRNSVKANGGWLNAQSARHVVNTTESTSIGYSKIWRLLNFMGTVGKCPSWHVSPCQTTHAQYQPIQTFQWRSACHTGPTLDEWPKFLGAKFASPDADMNRSPECEQQRTTSSVTRNCTSVSRHYDAAKLLVVTVCLWRQTVGRWRRRRNLSESAASCGTPNVSRRSVACL